MNGHQNDHKRQPLDDEGAPPASALADEGAEPRAETGEGPDPFKALENLQAENVALKDKSLRVMAEMENLRRRTEKEVADARAYGVSNFARDMLTLSDNLERAIESAPKEESGPLKTLVDGLDLIERDFQSRLSRHGVKKMESLGQKFDPNKHEALFEIPDATVPAGTVLQVVEQGFTIGDRVLRPAKVGVSKGGPKA
ncbi:MAG: nucleotide exchange factor GrpE [Hyphomicrobiales bacterium]|nr:nucleotide exchange factor GrpE [Hyphomicrobiales bacterium]